MVPRIVVGRDRSVHEDVYPDVQDRVKATWVKQRRPATTALLLNDNVAPGAAASTLLAVRAEVRPRRLQRCFHGLSQARLSAQSTLDHGKGEPGITARQVWFRALCVCAQTLSPLSHPPRP